MKIIRVLPGVLNEADILAENLEYYIDQGIETVVVDNGSTDGSYEIAQSYLGQGVVALERVETPDHNIRLLLRIANRMYKKLCPDWVVLADADEFIEAPYPGVSLRDAICKVGKTDQTLIAMSHILFQLTKGYDSSITSVRKRLPYYAKASDQGRAKIWKESEFVELYGAHRPDFLRREDVVMSPEKFIMRHYPFRSLEQAKRKIERLRPSVNNPWGWNIHYIKLNDVESLMVDPAKFEYYADNCSWKYDNEVPSDGLDITVSGVLEYYVKQGPEHVEITVEHFQKNCPRWKSEPRLLKFFGDIYRLSGNQQKAGRYYSESFRLCEETLSELASHHTPGKCD